MEAEGQAERSACAEISLNGMAVGSIVEDSLYPNTHLRTYMCVNVSLSPSPSPQTTDDIVSSAECSSDDEDLEECDSGHAGGMGVSSCACSPPGLFLLYLSLICQPRSLSSEHHVPWELQV